MDVVSDSRAWVRAGKDFEADGQPLKAIECFESAIDLLVEDREDRGIRLPHIVEEATGLGHLLRVLVAIEDDGAAAVLVHMLDRWEDARTLDPRSVETPGFVDAMDVAGHRAMRLGDLHLAYRALVNGLAVAQRYRDAWLRAARDGAEAVGGARAVLGIESLQADVLRQEGEVGRSAGVLRGSIEVVDELGFFPIPHDRASQPLLAETHLIGRCIDREIASGADPQELRLMHGRYWRLLASTFDAAIDEEDETKAALVIRLAVDAVRKAVACGRADDVMVLSDEVEARVAGWAASDSVIAQVLAGDVAVALEVVRST